MKQRTVAWLTLASAPHLSTRKAHEILQKFTLEEVAQALHERPHKIGLKAAPEAWQHLIDQALLWYEQADDHFILTPDDSAYPALLKQIPDAPCVLFVQGQINTLQKSMFAVVGSRQCTPAGRQNAYQFSLQLAQQGLVITSGLALGIDTQAHLGAVEHDYPTIAVLGTGLNQIYPKRNKELAYKIREKGCLVSEFFPDTVPFAYNFPKRNRIISGMSRGTLVVEAAIKSGSLITARLALEQNREVFAIPGSILNPYSEGCHQLIQQGAQLVYHVHDIYNELNLKIDVVQKSSSEERQTEPELLSYIGYEITPIDYIVEESGLLLEQLLEPLLNLELEGWIVSVSGGYTRIRRS
tara:strand:+ start:19178 stop:20239 length:1062 start_codon:yes stop_codon:yes gene_type:complete